MKEKDGDQKMQCQTIYWKTALNIINAHYGEHDCDPSNRKPNKAFFQNDHDFLSTQFADKSQLTPAVVVANLIGRTGLSEGFGTAVAQAE